jgi:hypothetical protein
MAVCRTGQDAVTRKCTKILVVALFPRFLHPVSTSGTLPHIPPAICTTTQHPRCKTEVLTSRAAQRLAIALLTLIDDPVSAKGPTTTYIQRTIRCANEGSTRKTQRLTGRPPQIQAVTLFTSVKGAVSTYRTVCFPIK